MNINRIIGPSCKFKEILKQVQDDARRRRFWYTAVADLANCHAELVSASHKTNRP